MTPNEELVDQFYTSFGKKDFQGMQHCYADSAIFNDAVFKHLNAEQVKAMWQMLLSRSGDLKIVHRDVREKEGLVTAHWEASYTFTATGNKVLNKIDAEFEIQDGKIVRHTDHFNFYNWAKQAFGGGGFLLGWTKFFREKVTATAMKKLEEYRSKVNLR
jgi:ketosteroid isomerase-like protein